MNTSQLLQRLGAACPWWREAAIWHQRDPDLRGVLGARFGYEPLPLEGLREGGLYILRGPRRVGKSVEIKRAIHRLLRKGVAPRRIIYFPCDELVAGDLDKLIKAARYVATRSETQPRYWFLDEITAIGGKWWATIKWLRDNDPDFRADCVVLTGSSMRGLDEAVKALAGRRGRVADSERLLLPMGFRQFCKATARSVPSEGLAVDAAEFRDPHTADAIGEAVPWLEDLILAWEAYIDIGGYARAVNDFLEQSAVGVDFTNSLWDVVSGEALRRARDFAPAKSQLLLTLLAAALTNPLTMSALSQNLGVAPQTAQERVADLTAAFICWPCYPTMMRRRVPDHRSAKGSHPKVYFTDSLLARLACLRDPSNTPCPDPSAVSEQQFGLTLLRQAERQQPGSFSQFTSLLYARTSTKEVDFTGPWMQGVAFESKYVDASWKREATTLRALTDRGVIVTRSVLDLEGDVWAVPVALAAWLLDAPPRAPASVSAASAGSAGKDRQPILERTANLQ